MILDTHLNRPMQARKCWKIAQVHELEPLKSKKWESARETIQVHMKGRPIQEIPKPDGLTIPVL